MRSMAVALLALLAAGCFQVNVYAPHGPPVKLLPRDEPACVARENRMWFGVYGLVAITNVQPAELMAREDLRAVRVTVVDTVPDALIALFYNIVLPTGLVNQSYVVAGNRAPGDVPGARGSGMPSTGSSRSP